MTKRLVIGDYLGKEQVFIQKTGGDSSLANVYNNIDDFVFHSDFRNLKELGIAVRSFTVPAIASISQSNPYRGGKNPQDLMITSKKYIQRFLVSGVYVDAGVHCLAEDVSNRATLLSGYPFQSTADSFRFASIEYVGNQVFLRIDSSVGENSLPSKTITIRVQAFRVDSPASDGSGIIAKIKPDRVQFKEGAFDSDRAYLYKTTSAGAGTYKIPTKKILKLAYQDRPELIMTHFFLGLSYNYDGVSSSFYLDSYAPNQTPIKIGVI